MEKNVLQNKNKIFDTDEEKLIREVYYNSAHTSKEIITKQPYSFNLEILKKNPQQVSHRVFVSIKPKPPTIKTLYVAEKNRFYAKKDSISVGFRLANGDHSSSASCGKLNICKTNSEICDCESYSVTDNKSIISERTNSNNKTISKCNESTQVFNEQQKYNKETCCVHSTQVSIMNSVETDVTKDQLNKVHKIDKATLIITNTSSEESLKSKSSIINQLNNRIDYLERKIIKQELVLDSIDPALTGCSLDDERKMKRRQETFIEQYSHVPETSAFQRHIQQAAPLSPSKATTIEKEHNSEQYGRDFTAYDGITARGRRQCASVPLRRDEIPKIAAERVHKIRHKLNPVRDYRLMDTVHYLAQGEFAPRDDGIKLTPSREAVLSDIIWEDVCRTHWPTTRLSRRLCHPQRHSTRSELQRLIDNLLRERIAHVERRRRRHYKIVKLNHRHETCRPIGKTGDIIVASHKNKHLKEDSNHRNSEPATAMTSRKYWLEQNQVRKDPDKIIYQNAKDNHHACCCDVNECVPGPSHNVCSRACRKNPTYYCQTVERPIDVLPPDGKQSLRQNETRGSTSSTSNRKNGSQQKSPRFVVKKESSRRTAKDELNPEHYILLPTLVVRTPSNVRRQKTFNELYHRILNIQMQHEKEPHNHALNTQAPNKSPEKKDISFNINVTLSESENRLRNKL